eukprot:5224668-Amphidinium_carterae.1
MNINGSRPAQERECCCIWHANNIQRTTNCLAPLAYLCSRSVPGTQSSSGRSCGQLGNHSAKGSVFSGTLALRPWTRKLTSAALYARSLDNLGHNLVVRRQMDAKKRLVRRASKLEKPRGMEIWSMKLFEQASSRP